MNNKTFIYNFLNRRMLCVLSTVGPDNMPESAVMEFGQTKDLELIFDTPTTTRKYTNLMKNPKIAAVLGWEEMDTVQYEGIAKELSGKELKRYTTIMFAKNPDFQKWEATPHVTYFKITPLWIRYTSGDGKSFTLRFGK